MGIIDHLKAGIGRLTGSDVSEEFSHWIAGRGQELQERFGITHGVEINEVSENIGNLIGKLHSQGSELAKTAFKDGVIQDVGSNNTSNLVPDTRSPQSSKERI